MHQANVNTEERFDFTSKDKRNLLITIVAGIVIMAIGAIIVMNSGHGGDHGEEGHALIENTQQVAGTLIADESGAEGGESHGSPVWLKRIYVTLWHNNIFFAGLGLIGVLFVAIHYAAQAGWSAGIKRVAEPFGYWIPVSAILTFVLFFVAGHDIFHWTHTDLYEEGGAHFDYIINGKKGFFFWPISENPGFPAFWIMRGVIFFVVWYLLFLQIRKWSLKEDVEGGSESWTKQRTFSTLFIIFFGVSSSIAAWDWVMSIDTHWFSTMFGWYNFASWWVAGLALITLLVIMLKERGYLSVVNANHLHDMGKFVFAFSIFWTYIWFSQFLLIYYANIPEETIYFVERMTTGQYAPVFYINILLNFVFPFLLLMTRDSKRHMSILKIVCIGIVFGHWLDFYLMITPGTMQFDGGFGFIEIGATLMFLGAFLWVILTYLSKTPLVAKNHPMLEESLHHHI